MKKTKSKITWKESVLYAISEIEQRDFTLDDVYNFEQYFKKQFPGNRNIKAKIRQTLQFLRNDGFVRFMQSGVYQKLK